MSSVLRVLLGMCQSVEAQDLCDQKTQHALQGRNFLVAVQLFEDRKHVENGRATEPHP